MLITKCHVESFGRLSNFDLLPSPGFNIIEEANGFGKTTFSYFIKAMLYGLSSGRKTAISENERKRFSPWQGGIFGGYMEIEASGGSYRIERTFGAKESADTCKIYDLSTGLETDRLLPSPGLALFGVDADTFERTCFFSERRLSMHNDGGVIGRLASLIENYNYSAAEDNTDAAIKLIQDSRREVKPFRGSGGETGRIAEALTACRKKYAECMGAGRERVAIEGQLADIEDRLAECRKRIYRSTELSRACRAAATALERRRAVAAIEERLSNVAERIKEYACFFGTDRPPEKAITEGLAELSSELKIKSAAYSERAAELSRIETELSSDQMTAAASVSDLNITEGEEACRTEAAAVAELDRIRTELEGIRRSLSLLNEDFPNGFPTEAELAAASDAAGRKATTEALIRRAEEDCRRSAESEAAAGARIALVREENEKAKGEAERQFRRGRLLAVIGAAAFVIGLPLALVTLIFLSLSGGGLLIAAFGLATISRSKRIATVEMSSAEQVTHDPEPEERHRSLKNALANDEKTVAEFMQRYAPKSVSGLQDIFYIIRSSGERYAGLTSALSDCENAFKEADSALSAASKALATILARDSIANSVDLRSKLDAYGNLRRSRSRLNSLTEQAARLRSDLKEQENMIDRLTETIASGLSVYPGLVAFARGTVGFDPALSLMAKKAWEYERALEEFSKTEAELRATDPDMPEASELEALSPEQLSAKESEADATLNEALTEKEGLDKSHSELLLKKAELEAIEDKAPELAGLELSLEERLESLRRLSDLYDMAADLLKTARENVAGKYVSALRASFEDYADSLSPDTSLKVDNQLGISYEALGSTRGEDTLSRGQRGVAELCIRLATTDTLYAAERPPILIDDAFAELDSQNLSRAMTMLCEASEKYQMIYFTCRPERLPTDNKI